MRRTFKYLLRPTVQQQIALTAMLNDHRALYNAALQERRDAYQMCGVSIRYGGQSAQLKDIRRADPDLARWSFFSQQSTLRRLNRAFEAFFRRVKVGQAPGYPRFKGAGWFDTVEWPKDGDGCHWDSVTGERRVYLQGVGHVRVNQHRPIAGTVKTISVKREGRRWFVVLSCDDVPAKPQPPTRRAIGIDLGVESFLVTSDGDVIDGPHYQRASAKKLAGAQRALSRCKRGSQRRRKVRERVAAIHGKIRRRRLDHAHKTANQLVAYHDVICYEALQITNMSRKPKPKPDPDNLGEFLPNGAAAKAGLNRSILDAGWGVFLRILASKAESADRELIAVNPRNTSRRCIWCEHCCAENRISQAVVRCVRCGRGDLADFVGAVNVLRAGVALREAAAAA